MNLPEIAKVILERNGSEIVKLDDKYREDETYVRIALKSNKLAYASISDDLKHRQEFIDMAKGIHLIEFPTDVLKGFSKKYILEATRDGLFSEVLFGIVDVDRDIVREFLKYHDSFLPEEYSNDKELALFGLKNKFNGSNFFNSIGDELKNDKSFALEGLEIRATLYTFLSDDLKNDRDVVIKLLTSPDKNSGTVFNFPYNVLPEQYKHDQEIIELLLKRRPNLWQALTSDMQTKENLITALRSGLNTRMLKEELKDGDVIREMLKHPNERTSFTVLPKKLLTDEVVKRLLAAGVNIKGLPDGHPMRNNKEALILWINAGNRVFNDDYVCSDYDVALAAVKSNAVNIEQLTDELRKNPEIRQAAIESALRDYSDRWYRIPPELQTKEMIMELLDEAPALYIYKENLAPELMKDFDIAVLACKLDNGNISVIDEELLADNDFINSIKKYCPRARFLQEKNEFLEIFDKTNEIKRIEIVEEQR